MIMNSAGSALIARSAAPARSYPNTLQKLARHFWYTGKDKNIVHLADELEHRPEVTVICVTGEDKQPLGIIRREQLFLSLSRRFGREIMSRYTVAESAEAVPVYAGERNILVFVEHLRKRNEELSDPLPKKQSDQTEYVVLVDSQGIFSGVLSLQDVANYMMKITNDDIAQASLLQERLLANTDEINQMEVGVDAWSSAAKGVGGDFYFIRKISDKRFFASLCDVSGKGVSAALVVSIVWGFLRSCDMRNGLKEMLVNLNSSIISSFHLEKYLTGFFMIYDAETRQLRVADMGHSHTVFLRDGKIASMEKTRVNLPVGVEPDLNPVVLTTRVQPGDSLLIYTDGITEQDNPAGEEFGEKRVVQLAQKAAAQNKPMSELLPQALAEFKQNTPQHDDMTFLLFRF